MVVKLIFLITAKFLVTPAIGLSTKGNQVSQIN